MSGKKYDIVLSDDESPAKARPKSPLPAPPAKKAKFAFKPKPARAPTGFEPPTAAENCLAGMTFVFTGELEKLSREEGQDLVKRYGGRVTSAPSSKTSYVVIGADAGPRKLEMIKKHKIKTLTEEGFLALLGSSPSKTNDPKYIAEKKKEEEKIMAKVKELDQAKDEKHLLQTWTDKYRPRKVTDICGNKGSIEKLSKWLEAWPKSVQSGFRKPGPDGMNVFRCVLISGPPGIGKTTAAHVVARQLGYTVLELNASDTRSKKLLEEGYLGTVNNRTLFGYTKANEELKGESGTSVKTVLIMDEVDGMSGGDRGGVGAVNQLIKKTKIPIIAICNDKSNPKMKPLLHTSFQLPFRRPTANEIRARMMSIAFKEGLKLDGRVIDQLVAGSQADLRKTLNMMEVWKLSQKTLSYDEGKKLSKDNEKNTIQTPWTLYLKLFSAQTFNTTHGLSLSEKMDIYFQDFQTMPLFVQENYLKSSFFTQAASESSQNRQDAKTMALASQAADSISDADLLDATIHSSEQQWGLLPAHAVLSTVRPAFFCHSTSVGQPAFPAWFGKNSTSGRLSRGLADIQVKMRLRASGSKEEIRQLYVPALLPSLTEPLRGAKVDPEHIESVISRMDDYFLSKDDWDVLTELGLGPLSSDKTLKGLVTATKTAFTRTYNKMDHPIAYNRGEGRVAKKLAAETLPDLEDIPVEDDVVEEEAEGEEDDSLEKDKLVKQKKAKPKKKKKGEE